MRDFFIKGYQNLSQNLAHFGFSLLILSILFNNIFSTEVITNLKVGQTFKSGNLIINFQSVDKKSEKNFQAVVGKFEIKEVDNNSVILNPELRIYNQPNIVTSEAAIKTNLLKGISNNQINNIVSQQIIPKVFNKDDICDIVEILIDKKFSSISGQTIHVGGI